MRLFKVLVAGGPKVGKTTLIVNFVAGNASEDHRAPPDNTVLSKTFEVEEVKYRLDISEITSKLACFGGKDKDKSFAAGDNYILVYSIPSAESLKSAEKFLAALKKCQSGRQSFSMVVVGNMSDLEMQRKVETEDGQKLAKSYGAAFLECSCLNIDDINKVFTQLVKEILKNGDRKLSTDVVRPILTYHKIFVLGGMGVGKSTFVSSFITGDPKNEPSSQMVFQKECEVDGRMYSLEIVSTPAWYDSIPDMEKDVPTADGFIVMFCITRQESMTSAETLLENIVKYGRETFPLVLVGNKLDLESLRDITYEDGKMLADMYSGFYIEVSSFNPDETVSVFEQIVREIANFDEARKPPIPAKMKTSRSCCSVI